MRWRSRQALVLIQRLLAVPFIVLGGWCLAAPGMVEALTFQPAYQHLSATSALLIGCFGAQALLCGLFILLTRFTRWTYLGYGLALLPFFFFNYYFVYVVPALNRWMARFRRRGLASPPSNRKQCYVIEGAEILENPNGTAPGLWLSTRRNRIALLPGPPREIRPTFERHVLPRLDGLRRSPILRRTIRLTVLGESAMESLLGPVYGALPPGVSVTTLASPGELSIRLSSSGPGRREAAEARLDVAVGAIRRVLGPYIYSLGGESLEAVDGALLKAKGLTIACAESCTGGLIGHRLTDIAGSSAYFLESAVVYGNEATTTRLGVPKALLMNGKSDL